MKNKITSAIIWVLALQLISYIMSLMHKDGMVWYNLINKSSLTPPSYVFMIVWPILYTILGIIGSFLWINRHQTDLKVLWHLFLVIILLTFIWSPAFFHYKSVLGGLIVLLAIIILTTLFVLKAYKHNFSKIALWMLPFLTWCLFAYYLNLVIWINNC